MSTFLAQRHILKPKWEYETFFRVLKIKVSTAIFSAAAADIEKRLYTRLTLMRGTRFEGAQPQKFNFSCWSPIFLSMHLQILTKRHFSVQTRSQYHSKSSMHQNSKLDIKPFSKTISFPFNGPNLKNLGSIHEALLEKKNAAVLKNLPKNEFKALKICYIFCQFWQHPFSQETINLSKNPYPAPPGRLERRRPRPPQNGSPLIIWNMLLANFR